MCTSHPSVHFLLLAVHCVQLPAIVSDKVCIVISPLISLMEDQVAALNARGIAAAFLGSAQTNQEASQAHISILHGWWVVGD